MRVGIVGLPNVGKSTVFNSLTRAGAEAQNYPFTTIDPNLGVAAVPDGRLEALSETMKSRRVVPATVDFVDIAGLVRGASSGEGLGNQFLGHIRECDAIAHVVRCFVDEDVVHVEGKVDPEGDAETINTELLLADLATVERRLDRVGRAAKGGDAKLKAEAVELEKLLGHLSGGNPARSYPATDALAEALGTLITAKPTLYVANVDEESVAEGNEYSARVEELAAREGAGVVRLSARLEAEIVDLGEGEAREYLEMLGLQTTGFQEFVRAAYRLLGLVTFFTAGEKESRAWTVREGSTARTAAGRIHSDMERGFIAAEVGDWEDIVAAGSWSKAKESASIRLEGRDYVVKDGDTALIRFNV
jgi:GTP-binding protein YchF